MKRILRGVVVCSLTCVTALKAGARHRSRSEGAPVNHAKQSSSEPFYHQATTTSGSSSSVSTYSNGFPTPACSVTTHQPAQNTAPPSEFSPTSIVGYPAPSLTPQPQRVRFFLHANIFLYSATVHL